MTLTFLLISDFFPFYFSELKGIQFQLKSVNKEMDDLTSFVSIDGYNLLFKPQHTHARTYIHTDILTHTLCLSVCLSVSLSPSLSVSLSLYIYIKHIIARWWSFDGICVTAGPISVLTLTLTMLLVWMASIIPLISCSYSLRSKTLKTVPCSLIIISNTITVIFQKFF